MSTEQATLLTPGRRPFTVSAARYLDADRPRTQSAEARIYIRIRPANLDTEILAMVDTGAPWCILEPRVGAAIRDQLEELYDDVSISTRLGTFTGTVYLGTVTFVADEGEPVTIEATVFVSPDWTGGNFAGYLGFLDRIRFAFDPDENLFYSGPLKSEL